MGLQIRDLNVVISKIRRNVTLPITSANIAQYELRDVIVYIFLFSPFSHFELYPSKCI
jgi:hypothetical protein